jgi:hypothetical protein
VVLYSPLVRLFTSIIKKFGALCFLRHFPDEVQVVTSVYSTLSRYGSGIQKEFLHAHAHDRSRLRLFLCPLYEYYGTVDPSLL